MTPYRKITFRLGEVYLPNGKSDLWALLSGVSTLTTEHGPRMDLGNSAYAATVIRDVGSCGARVAQTPAQCGCLPLELSPQERCFDNNDNWSVDTARISTGGECHCCPPGSFGFWIQAFLVHCGLWWLLGLNVHLNLRKPLVGSAEQRLVEVGALKHWDFWVRKSNAEW